MVRHCKGTGTNLPRAQRWDKTEHRKSSAPATRAFRLTNYPRDCLKTCPHANAIWLLHCHALGLASREVASQVSRFCFVKAHTISVPGLEVCGLAGSLAIELCFDVRQCNYLLQSSVGKNFTLP